MAVFPTDLPTNTDPTSGNTLNSPDHAGLHQSHNAEIVAVETKVGTGASTPVVNRLLYGTGTGTSAWTQLTSAQLAASLSDETGSGVAVFGTAPTLGSPVITTPRITTSINDSNGNEVIKTPATGSATNEITVTNAATGSAPSISATGSSDSNINLIIAPKGTGVILVDSFYGWQRGSNTWTYASAITFTVPAADIALMSAGTKIWLTQTTSKYFYVASVSGTTVTIDPSTDYTLVNAAITAPYFSNVSTPIGFPAIFSWTPTLTNLSGGTLNYSKYTRNGKVVNYRFKYTLAGAGVSGNITFSPPTTMTSDYAATDILNSSTIFYDLSATTPYMGQAFTSTTTAIVLRSQHTDGTRGNFELSSSSDPFTFAVGDIIYDAGTYDAL